MNRECRGQGPPPWLLTGIMEKATASSISQDKGFLVTGRPSGPGASLWPGKARDLGALPPKLSQ